MPATSREMAIEALYIGMAAAEGHLLRLQLEGKSMDALIPAAELLGDAFARAITHIRADRDGKLEHGGKG